MTAYFDYLRQIVIKFFEHLGTFLYKGFISPLTDVRGAFAVICLILRCSIQQHLHRFDDAHPAGLLLIEGFHFLCQLPKKHFGFLIVFSLHDVLPFSIHAVYSERMRRTMLEIFCLITV